MITPEQTPSATHGMVKNLRGTSVRVYVPFSMVRGKINAPSSIYIDGVEYCIDHSKMCGGGKPVEYKVFS